MIYTCLCPFNRSLIELSLEASYYFKFSKLGHVNVVSGFQFMSSVLMNSEIRVYLYSTNCLAADEQKCEHRVIMVFSNLS